MPVWITPALNVLGVLVSAFLSYRIARNTASAELKKLELTWQHEKEALLDSTYDKMVSAVTVYIARPFLEFLETACNAVGAYRAHAPAEMADSVDALSECLTRRDVPAVSAALSHLLEIRRKCNR
jgi:hypothetical protein